MTAFSHCNFFDLVDMASKEHLRSFVVTVWMKYFFCAFNNFFVSFYTKMTVLWSACDHFGFFLTNVRVSALKRGRFLIRYILITHRKDMVILFISLFSVHLVL